MTEYISSVSYPNGKLKVTFNHERMDTSFVNAIRRILMAEIKTYSLSGDIDIKSNTTKGLFKNNQLVERIVYQIPIFINEKNNKLLNKDPRFLICEAGNPNKPLINMNNEDLVVNAHDLQIFDPNDQLIDYPIDQLILKNVGILKIRKGEEMHLEVRPKEGIGRNDYSKWKCARVPYRYESYVSLGMKKGVSQGVNPITGEKFETNDEKQDYPITKYDEPTHITLNIASLDHYDHAESMIMALSYLENKLLTLRNMIDDPNSNQISKLKISYDDNIRGKLTIKITDLIDDLDGMDHNNPLATETLANLISSHVLYNVHDYVENKDMNVNQNVRSLFTTYRVPHPEDPIMEIYCKVPEELLPPEVSKSVSGNHPPSYKMFVYTLEQLAELAKSVKEEFQNKK